MAKPTDKRTAALRTPEARTNHVSSMAVGRYLDALAATDPAQGAPRRVTNPETMKKWLEKARESLSHKEGIARLKVLQRVRELERDIEALGGADDGLVAGFVEHAKAVADHHGIEYATFRDAGVPPEVLKAAGITRKG